MGCDGPTTAEIIRIGEYHHIDSDRIATAHAMKGDRERCLAAGMDGYLSKPIRPPELDDVLQSYLNRRMESAIKSQAAGSSR